GPVETKVEISLIPSDSYRGTPVVSVHSRQRADGSASPATSASRSEDRSHSPGSPWRSRWRKTPGTAAKWVALCAWMIRGQISPSRGPSWTMAVAAPAQGSVSPTPSVYVQLSAPACRTTSPSSRPYQPRYICRLPQALRWQWVTHFDHPDM